MQCEQLMSREIVRVKERDSLQVAALAMLEANVCSLAVCDERGRPVGTLSDQEIGRRICAGERRVNSTRVSEVMSRQIFACRTTDDVVEARRMLARPHICELWVVDPSDRVVGVLRREHSQSRHQVA